METRFLLVQIPHSIYNVRTSFSVCGRLASSGAGVIVIDLLSAVVRKTPAERCYQPYLQTSSPSQSISPLSLCHSFLLTVSPDGNQRLYDHTRHCSLWQFFRRLRGHSISDVLIAIRHRGRISRSASHLAYLESTCIRQV